MRPLEEEILIEGQVLRRFVFAPDPSRPVRAAAVHYHGQGDHSSRYEETMRVFTGRGVACVATDLPGHGESDGKRGVVPGFRVIDGLTRSAIGRARGLCPDGPLGILGHSAGGLLALHELLRSPSDYDFCWLSSPLVRPGANRSRLLVFLLPFLARLFAGHTVRTGVRPEDCRHDAMRPGPEGAGPLPKPGQNHGRIGLGWGWELLQTAAAVRLAFAANPPGVPLLVTQGTADRICRVEHLRALLARAAIPRLRYREFTGALHEPFADDSKAEVFAEIDRWLDEILRPLEALQVS